MLRWDNSIAENKWFVELADGMENMDDIKYTEIVSCPLCGFDKNKPVFEETFQVKEHNVVLGINECRACQLCYISPRLSVMGLSLLYNHAYLEQTVLGLHHVTENVSAWNMISSLNI
jgi:hypothetical protein